MNLRIWIFFTLFASIYSQSEPGSGIPCTVEEEEETCRTSETWQKCIQGECLCAPPDGGEINDHEYKLGWDATKEECYLRPGSLCQFGEVPCGLASFCSKSDEIPPMFSDKFGICKLIPLNPGPGSQIPCLENAECNPETTWQECSNMGICLCKLPDGFYEIDNFWTEIFWEGEKCVNAEGSICRFDSEANQRPCSSGRACYTTQGVTNIQPTYGTCVNFTLTTTTTTKPEITDTTSYSSTSEPEDELTTPQGGDNANLPQLSIFLLILSCLFSNRF